MDLAAAYDALNTVMFLPSGGSRRLRNLLVESLAIRPGQRVLELGCGTGQVTAELLAAGAQVVAVDRLPAMLARARQRAPRAVFIEGDAFEAEVEGVFDRVVLSFVLHNFESEARIRLLRRAAARLAPGGSIGVLEWALPAGRLRAALWRRFLRALEPAQGSVQDVLAGKLESDVASSDLRIARRQRVAGGRAEIVVLQPLA
jgi:ubiquinone/menaquinone biosynthesis C-methylase UbiE